MFNIIHINDDRKYLNPQSQIIVIYSGIIYIFFVADCCFDLLTGDSTTGERFRA